MKQEFKEKLERAGFKFSCERPYFLEEAKLTEARQWRKLTNAMPFIRFPGSWEVAIIPPFSVASCRFLVRQRGGNEKNTISVYFDSDSALGAMWEPYWEIYPNKEGDNERFLLGEENEMIKAIRKALRSKKGERG